MKDTDKQYFRQLLVRYRQGKASAEEIRLLESFYDLFEVNDDLVTPENEIEYQQVLRQRIDAQINESRPVYRRLWLRWSAAAIVLVAFGAGLLYLGTKHKEQTKLAKNQIQPGGNRAILQLANGTKIDLSAAGNGVIAKQSGITIHKNAKGLLVYTVSATQAAATGENMISTPRGGQYEVILPDGTHVMLNAASSLTYPVIFSGSNRLVKLTGEAYFEVAKDKAHPFKVSSGTQTVTVLGTHFNINAYGDEAAVKTTLLEGSVAVAAGVAETRIVPGQQAILAANGQLSKKDVDPDKEVAWKNGLFSFDGDDLKTIMRQVSRWYNVDITYSGTLPNEKFYGEITRSSKLADVLRIMELNNIHFDIDGRNLTVSYAPAK